MFNPFAPNRTRGRFAFCWDVVVHTATWLNAICATGPQPPPRCLSNLRILRSYIPTRSSVSGGSYTFPFHPPYIGAAGGLFTCGLSECVASVEHALRLFKMLLETVASSLLLDAFAILGRMSGSACNRRPWLERSWAGHLSGPLGTTI
jgi:hypothetical protein